VTDRSAVHATFAIERTYPASPARVFKAWADPAAKASWAFKASEFDFRVGGRELNRGGPPGGEVYTYDARYQDIVPDQRIVYSYTMDRGSMRISVSVATVEFKRTATGTQLILTEQGVFLDGGDTPAMREHGTRAMLDKLGMELSH